MMSQTSRIRDFGGKKRRWFGSKVDKGGRVDGWKFMLLLSSFH